MTDKSRTVDRMSEALNRYEDKNITENCIGVEYCVDCDKINLVIKQSATEGYRHIDCDWRHAVLEEGTGVHEITSWLNCITYFEDE